MGKLIAQNKKAYHNFEMIQEIEAGLELTGAEVKAIRAGRVNIKDSYIKIIKGEAYLIQSHISYLETTHSHYRPDESRLRKLLLHRKEIDKLIGKVSQEGLSIVALKLYFNSKNIAKLKIALAKGKNLHDKRDTLKKKTMDREAKQAMKRAY
jgi:SsrA-binding protein